MKPDPTIVLRNAQAAALAVSILGGASSAARILKVPSDRHQTVRSWMEVGVPAKWCALVEAATRERGQPITCSVLRPDVFIAADRKDRPTPAALARKRIEAWAKANPDQAKAEEEATA